MIVAYILAVSVVMIGPTTDNIQHVPAANAYFKTRADCEDAKIELYDKSERKRQVFAVCIPIFKGNL